MIMAELRFLPPAAKFLKKLKDKKLRKLYQEAIDEYLRIADDDTENHVVFLKLAELYEKTEGLQSAIDTLERGKKDNGFTEYLYLFLPLEKKSDADPGLLRKLPRDRWLLAFGRPWRTPGRDPRTGKIPADLTVALCGLCSGRSSGACPVFADPSQVASIIDESA